MTTQKLTDVQTLKHLLAQAGVAPQHSAGQNFLISDEVIEATLAALDETIPSVTELGAGLGTLTTALAGSGFRVRAIERDSVLAEILQKQLPKKLREQVEIITDDLREVEWPFPSTPREDSVQASSGQATADKAWQLVGNIPYNLSGLIIRRITQLDPAPERVILLAQREIADRLVAPPGEMSLLSLAAQLWGTATRLLRVPANCFWPQPKVDSSLVMLVPHPDTEKTLEERERILKFAKICFRHKRKQLGGVLKRELGERQAQARLTQAGVATTARPQELDLAQWRQLAQEL